MSNSSPNPIKFRRENLTLDARDVDRAGGADGEITAAIAEQRATLDAIEALDDTYSTALVEIGQDLITAEFGGIRLLMKVADDHMAKLRDANEMARGLADAAASSLPTSGWGGPQDLEVARDAARNQTFKTTQKMFAGQIVSKYADRAEDAAGEFSEAFVRFANCFDAAYFDYQSPSALSKTGGDFSIESIHRQSQIESDLRATKRPMAESIQVFESILRHWPNDKDRISMFTRAARALAIEIRDMSPPKIVARFGSDRGAGDDERGSAMRLLGMLEAYRNQSRPQSLDLAYALLTGAREVGKVLFGAEIRYVVRAECDIRGMPATGAQVDAARPWQLSDQWHGRYLSPSLSSPLPGWAPIVMKTRGGGVIRAPKA